MTPRVASLKGVVNSVVGRLHFLLCSGQCFVWQSTLQYAAIPQRLHLCLVWAAQTMHTNRGSPVLSRCLPASVPPFFAAPVTGLSEHELSIFTGLLPRDACVWHGTNSRRSAAVRARPQVGAYMGRVCLRFVHLWSGKGNFLVCLCQRLWCT